MKRLIYQVYVGKRSRLYDWCAGTVKDYAERIGADYICQSQPLLRIKPDIFATNRSKESYEKHGGYLPIYEKENAFSINTIRLLLLILTSLFVTQLLIFSLSSMMIKILAV